MSQTPSKVRLAAVKALNPAHIEEKDYKHVDKYHDILVCQNLRTECYRDIFEEADIFGIFKDRETFIDESLRVNLEYLCEMSNEFGVVKSHWGIGKTWLDVTVALLLIHLSKKVKMCSSSEKSADDFILEMAARVDELWAWGIRMIKKKFVRAHALTIEH